MTRNELCPQRAILTTQAASSRGRHTASGAIVGIAVGVVGGALVSSVCVAAGYLFLRWVPAPQCCSSKHTKSTCAACAAAWAFPGLLQGLSRMRGMKTYASQLQG